MFMLTLGRSGIKRLGSALLCAAVLSGALFAASRFSGGAAAPTAAAPKEELAIRTTQDIAAYFQGYGLEVDLTTAAIDEVKVPKKWNDDFAAFHDAVRESGGDLTRHKGKTVEKWTILCPGRSTGTEQTYGVLLVYKKAPLGAYLLTQPSGRVTGLEAAAQTAAPLTAEELAAAGEFGAEAGLTAETAAEPVLEEAGAEPVD